MSAILPQKLTATLTELEGYRRADLGKMALVLAVIALLVGVVLWLVGPVFAVPVGIFGVIGVVTVARYQILHLKTVFKQRVMPVLLSELDASLRYRQHEHVNQGAFYQSSLYKYPDRLAGKDLVSGRVGNVALQFSLLHAEERYEVTTTTGTGDNKVEKTETKYRTLFEGLFVVVEFNKHFAGKTQVRAHSLNLWGKLFGSEVKLESPEFDQQFTVTATDQVEARYILTPSLMERLLTLQANMGRFQAAFVGERLFLAFERPQDLFEPSIFLPMTHQGQITNISATLQAVVGIVEALGLNIRIWSKTEQETEI